MQHEDKTAKLKSGNNIEITKELTIPKLFIRTEKHIFLRKNNPTLLTDLMAFY